MSEQQQPQPGIWQQTVGGMKSFADAIENPCGRPEYIKRRSCRACGLGVEVAFLPTDHFQSALVRCKCGGLVRITFLKGEERGG